MLESIFLNAEASLSSWQVYACIGAALVAGIIIASVYMLTSKKGSFHKDFVIAIALLPAIVSVVIILVGSNVARALSLAGAFALVRFRSAPGSGKDIAVVFFAMATGLACGLGYVVFAIIIMVAILAVLAILSKSSFAEVKVNEKQLKITIPEDLNYNGIFDDLFAEYTNSHKLSRVRTTNMGSLYELVYLVDMKDEAKEKDFIDSLRCRNGNLNISLGLIPEKSGLTL